MGRISLNVSGVNIVQFLWVCSSEQTSLLAMEKFLLLILCSVVAAVYLEADERKVHLKMILN